MITKKLDNGIVQLIAEYEKEVAKIDAILYRHSDSCNEYCNLKESFFVVESLYEKMIHNELKK